MPIPFLYFFGLLDDKIFIANPFIEPWLEKHFPDHDDSVGGTMSVQKTCYQCEGEVGYLFEDGRCWKCTRVDHSGDIGGGE